MTFFYHFGNYILFIKGMFSKPEKLSVYIDRTITEMNNIGVGSSNQILEKIDCLRGPVRDMNKNEQDKVMKYMQNLLKLSDMYL